jgi:hypothetical protein
MDTLGTLVLSMYVSVPSLKGDGKSKGKHVVFARYHRLTLAEAHEAKQAFIMCNPLKSDRVDGQWIVREYL